MHAAEGEVDVKAAAGIEIAGELAGEAKRVGEGAF